MPPHPAPVSATTPSGKQPVLNDYDKLWDNALERYKKETGKSLRKHSSAQDFLSKTRSADEIIAQFEEQNESFVAFRDSGAKIRGVLKPVVDVVLFLKENAEGASDAIPGGDKIFGAIGVLLQATQGVSDRYDAIEVLLRKVLLYLERLKIYFEPPAKPSAALKNILVDALVQVFVSLAIATKYCIKSNSWFKRVVRILFRRGKDYFLVLTDQDDVKEVLTELEKLAVDEVQFVIAEMQPRMGFVYDEAVVNSFRSWLRPPNEHALNHESKRQPDSCKWFLDDKFDEWKASKNGVYWVYGNAGAGKSILCSSVIDTLKETPKQDPALSLVYFYFDYSDTKKLDCRALTASLVFQLANCSEACQSYLQGKQSPRSPTFEELLVLLSGLLPLSGRTFIVIDALDECPEHARNRTGLWRLFEHLRSLWNQGNTDVRVFVTSRPEIDIKNYMSSFATRELNINVARAHTEDIKNYLSTWLFGPESEAFSHWDVGVKWRVYNELDKKSDGMFLWLVLQLQDLKHCAANGIERALDKLPSDLYETYERILENFPPNPIMVALAHRVFECVALAMEPLSPVQVAEIMSMDFDSAPPWKPLMSEIVSDDEGHKTVQFIHRSVQEYLTSATLRQAISSPAHPYSIDKSSAHLTLAKICLSVLVVDGPPSDLQEYADAYWYEHVSSRDEDALAELLDLFLQMDSPSFARWEGRTHGTINTAFHWAARLGLYRRVERMLERSQRDSSTPADSLVRIRDGWGKTALHWAAPQGHVDFCRLLLEHGALVEDTDNVGGTPLHYAASNGHLDVVRLLLEYPAADGSNAAALRCSIRNDEGQTALHWAAYEGHAEVCRLLLEYGALVDEADNDGKTALQLAKEERKSDVVDVLLKHGATAVSGTLSLEGESDCESSL